MIRYECDRCSAALGTNDPNRFIVKLEVFAAADHVDLSQDDAASTSGQLHVVLEQLRTADPDEIEDKTYRSFRFDVCDNCRKYLIANPLPRNRKA